jgi:penicillin-binding protein 1A
VTLQELTTAYGAIADGGVRHDPLTILSVRDRGGRVLEEHAPTAAAVLSPDTAHVLTNMLQTVVSDGTGWKVKELGRPVAGTGTTSDYVDAWFMGFTPDLVTGSGSVSTAARPRLARDRIAGNHPDGSDSPNRRRGPSRRIPVPPGVVFANRSGGRAGLAWAGRRRRSLPRGDGAERSGAGPGWPGRLNL